MESESTPPEAHRVARRALALSAVYGRCYAQDHPDPPVGESVVAGIRRTVEALDLELEPEERRYIETPLGRGAQQDHVNAFWRREGLVVLVWALGADCMPSYDSFVDLDAVFESAPVNLADPDAARRWIEAARLRPMPEIDALVRHITIVRWRLVEMRRSGRNVMDYRAYLPQHPSFRPAWLEGLAFGPGGDLAFGGVSLGELPEEAFHEHYSANVERQLAGFWLQGEAELYSEVQPATILAALDPPNEAASAAMDQRESERARAEAERKAKLERASSSSEASDEELLAAAERLPLLRFEKTFVAEARRAAASGELTPGQRARLLEFIAKKR